MATESPIPTDLYSKALREVQANPEALGSSSTIHTRDFYGNSETWNIETYRVEDREVVFLQHNTAGGGTRHVLPAEVTAAIGRQREQLVGRARRRGARRAIETRKLRGDKLGNPAAFAKARRKRGGK